MHCCRSPFQAVAAAVICLVLQACWLWPVGCMASSSSSQEGDGAKDCEVGTDGTCVSTNDNSRSTPPLECGVYMAPSTLGEDTNMGIYTGIPLKEGDVIHYPEIVIPLLFREWGDHKEGFDDGTLWDRYIWEGDIMNIESYEDTNREKTRAVFVPGVGCTVNSILDMNNIESTHGSIYDTAGLHRSKDPGTTAFTPYHSAQTTVTIPHIAVGAELFASYGDYWIPDIPGVQVTLEEELDKAEEFLRTKYLPWMDQQNHKLSPELKQALWNFTLKFPVYDPSMSNLPRVEFAKVEEFWNTKRKQLEGANDDEDEEEEEDDDESSIVRHFIRHQSIRSVDWLNEHGYCQDHLQPGRSTILQAGRGAFATRFLPVGTIVAYSPLVHIGEHGRDILTIEYPDGRPPKFDLIINYSFGHRNSTIMLTPYGGMVNYINHASAKSTKDSKYQPNIKIRWPSKDLVAHKTDWLTKPPSELRDIIEKIGLSFEYVAIRDIQPGEEVLMDYGDEWEAGWNAYVEQWKPEPDADKYKHVSEWKEPYIRTVKELETNPYPPNFVTLCYESYTVSDTDNNTYEWLPVLRALHHRIYCTVVERFETEPTTTKRIPGKKKDYTYTVMMHLKSGENVLVHHVEPTGIFLYDRAYSQDWHLPNAFRHPIMIPDEIMPEAWMNGPPPTELHQRKKKQWG